MKRITLNVDLDDNEILGEEIKSTIQDTARQYAREQYHKVVEKEIDRIIEGRVEQLTRSYIVRNEISQTTRRVFLKYLESTGWCKDAAENAIKAKVDSVDTLITKVIGDLEQRTESIIHQRIDELFKDNLTRMILEAIAHSAEQKG